MRIISKFTDYYDGYMDHSKEQLNKVWVRTDVPILIPRGKLTSLRLRRTLIDHHWIVPRPLPKYGRKRFYTDSDYSTGYLILAGKAYPFVVILYDYDMNEYSTYGAHRFFFDLESLEEAYPTLVTFKGANHMLSYNHRAKFVEFFSNVLDVTNLCLEYRVPILMYPDFITTHWNRLRHDETEVQCATNFCLKDIGISKTFNALQMYQMLDHFVSNVLTTLDEMPPAPQTDEDKMLSHGFDHPYSFRKPPKGE